jgi:hypothetical protein
VEAQLERVGDTHDLEDAALDQAVRPCPDGRLRDAEISCDLREGPSAVGLEVFDDALVERRDLIVRATGRGARPRTGRARSYFAGFGRPGLVVGLAAGDHPGIGTINRAPAATRGRARRAAPRPP